MGWPELIVKVNCINVTVTLGTEIETCYARVLSELFCGLN